MLLVFSSIFASHTNSVRCVSPDSNSDDQTIPVSEFANPSSQFYLAIEANNFAPGITEVHRLLSLLIHPNRVIPLNFDFRSMVFIPVKLNSNSPVSIFIRGHSLLN